MAKKKKLDEKKEGPTSLFILRETNFIRRATKFLIEWPPFEYTVLLTIIANCVVLAVERPLPNGDKTELARQLVSQSYMITRLVLVSKGVYVNKRTVATHIYSLLSKRRLGPISAVIFFLENS